MTTKDLINDIHNIETPSQISCDISNIKLINLFPICGR